MLIAVEFMAENKYSEIDIKKVTEDGYGATIVINGDHYTGYAENGHIALLKAIQRFRETNPEDPGVMTMTISADRDAGVDGVGETHEP